MLLKIKFLFFFGALLSLFQTAAAQELSYVNYVHILPGASRQEIMELAANLKPSSRQYDWQQLELIAFVHFGMNTFTNVEWGDGTADPQQFNPSQLDAEQWVTTCQNAGFKMMILTVKHHDGFCLWPSQFTDYSVKNSPWKNGQGDVVREFADACRKYGMKMGIYLSPWDRHSPYFGTDAYNDYFVNQLTELLTNYGTISEVWLDGANGEGPSGKTQVYDEARWFSVIRKLQPGAVIAIAGPDVRWVGTETGYGKETEWSLRAATIQNRAVLDSLPPEEGAFMLESSSPGTLDNLMHEQSIVWYPVEADVSIRPGWFYHPEEDSVVKTPAELFDIYCSSAGRNDVLLLNVPPDTRGLINDKDIASLAGFKQILSTTFAVNFLDGASVSHFENTPAGQGLTTHALVLEYTLPDTATFDLLQLGEDLRTGQRIEGFKLEYDDGNDWKEITRGTTVGYKRILRFDPVSARHIRFTVDSSRLIPALSEIGLYKQGDLEPENRETAMKWWRDAHFGMFIHWGVYAVYGNMYQGITTDGDSVNYDKRCTGKPSEWIMSAAKIPRATYRKAAGDFDANDYDPKKWVATAKDAGMKYIIVTAKHHDGFCLFGTQYTDWNAVDASAAHRDLLKELVTEAKAAGLKIGFYYSQNVDWMQKGGMGAIPELNGGLYPVDQVETYVNTIVIPQIQELTSNYDIDIFWFDSGNVPNSNTEISRRIEDALLNSPVGNKIIFNNRLYPGFDGDFSTPETDTPTIPYNGYDDNRAWEACASLNNSWGFEYEPDVETVWNADRWKTAYYEISRLLEITSKGGNYLLNVGPDRHGTIPEPALNTLHEVGEWMKTYGAAIYGAERNSLVQPFEYGYVTQKTDADGSIHWYLHVSSAFWKEKEIAVNGIAGLPVSAVLFDSKKPVDVRIENNNLILSLPDSCPNPYYAAIDLRFKSLPLQVNNFRLRNSQVRLTPYQAITTAINKNFIPYALTNWYTLRSQVEFNVYLEAGTYDLESEYACWSRDGELYFTIDDQDFTAAYKNTGNPAIGNDINHYVPAVLIKGITLPVSKVYSIKITRNAEIPGVLNWINVRSFTFRKTSETGIETPNVSVYPVFVKDRYLVCESPNEQTLRIYDAIGRLRKTGPIGGGKTVDVHSLEPGVYIIKGDHMTQKIVL